MTVDACMTYDITHSTTYNYRDTVSVSHHVVRLTPRQMGHQRCLSHELEIHPRPAIAKSHVDYFGNEVTFLTVEGAHRKLVVTSKGRVAVTRRSSPLPAETPAWESVREACRGTQQGPGLEASEFLFDSPLVKANDDLQDYASVSFCKERPMLEAVLDLTARIHRDFKFDPQATTIATPLEEVFKNRRGVCQDFAQLQIGCLRSLGLPARYVSGYLETDPPAGQVRLAGADASHAWLSVYGQGLGWLDVDPTNNLLTSNRHITVAWGRDFSDVSPLRGVIVGSGDHTLKVAVDVIPCDLPDPAGE